MERARLDCGPQQLGDLGSGGRRGLRQQQDKLLAAKPGNEITATQALAQLVGDDLEYFVPSQVPIAVVDSLEMVQVEDRHRQMAAVRLPFEHFALDPLAPGRTVGQAGEGVEQGLLALLFKVLAVAERLLLHVRHPLRQPLQAPSQLLFAAITLVLVLVHGHQQAFQAVFQDVLEAVNIGGTLHTALQPVDMLSQLGIQLAGGRAVVGMPGTGLVQVTLETFEAFVELLQVGFEFMLTAVSDGQHEHSQVIQYRDQLIPVQAAGDPFTHLEGLCLVSLRQAEVIEQADQGVFDVLGDLTVGRLYRVGQGIGAVLAEGFFECLNQSRSSRRLACDNFRCRHIVR